MSNFRSGDDYKHFAWRVRELATPESDLRVQEFLHALLRTSEGRVARGLGRGSIVWRAQIGIDERPLVDRGFATGLQPFPPERMKPTAETAAEGRVNAKGQPCFYCANTARTAMSEVRPWLGSHVSIARFIVNKDLKLLTAVATDEPDVDEIAGHVWSEVGFALSEPMTRKDPALEYAPTQLIASFFKANGFDGILYASLLAGERNIAIFDLDAVDIFSCSVRQVRSLQYGFGRHENEYRIGADKKPS